MQITVPKKDNLRHSITLFVILVIFFIIVARLMILQLIDGHYYRQRSEQNRIKTIDIIPARGSIFDRNGVILASNEVTFDLYLLPAYANAIENTAKLIACLFSMDYQLLLNKFKEAKRKHPYSPVLIKKRLGIEELAKVKARELDMPGLYVEERPRRVYLNGGSLCHVLGYMGEITKEELANKRFEGYRAGDMVGRKGVERLAEEYLRGQRGGSQVEIDALGRVVAQVAKISPINGHNIYLTIDYRLQRAVEEELQNLAGAIVCMDPNTGDVIAMASSPGFNPNVFAEGISSREWEELKNHEFSPLTNRAIAGLYPPGSVFKIITALAALEEGITTPEERLFCTGSYQLGDTRFGCWREHGHGAVDMRRAIVESCDYYFYEMGRRLGIDRIARYSRALGLGEKVIKELPEEKEGIVPSREWKLRELKRPWYLGETISCSIGQGYVSVTPIQMARMVSAIFNGGYVVTGNLIRAIDTVQGIINTPKERERIRFRDSHLRLVQEALWGVVNTPGGTGTKARAEGLDISGKTGTAQVIRLTKRERNIEKVPYQQRDHAWFVAVAPYDEPKIAVAVLIEHGGHGGSAAAPIAGRIIKTYLEDIGS